MFIQKLKSAKKPSHIHRHDRGVYDIWFLAWHELYYKEKGQIATLLYKKKLNAKI